MKRILLIFVSFTDFGEASSFCGPITDTWKSTPTDGEVRLQTLAGCSQFNSDAEGACGPTLE